MKEHGHHPGHAVATVVTDGVFLPPEKAGHFMIGRTRVLVADIFQGLFGVVSTSVILEAGIPSLSGQRLPLRVLIVALVRLSFGSGAVGTWERKVPAQGVVPDANLEKRDRIVRRVVEFVTNSDFDSRFSTASRSGVIELGAIGAGPGATVGSSQKCRGQKRVFERKTSLFSMKMRWVVNSKNKRDE